MAREGLPVTPALITWARTRAGITLENAKNFGRIAEWEAGEASPTYAQLEALANAFKVPVAVFFFPEPPSVPEIGETFRTLPDADFNQIPSRIQLLLRKAKALQLNLAELTGDKNASSRIITRDLKFDPNMKLSDAASLVREYLGVTLETQKAWPDDEVALKAWRDAVQSAGVYVFKDAFRNDDFSGFCLFDETFPIIYVNNSSTKTRQCFTIFHELAHLLFHTSGIDKIDDDYVAHLKGDDQKIEVFCNRFAAEFLFPEQEFDAAMKGQAPTESTAEILAARYHVSREFVFRRFLNRKWIDENTYSAGAKRWSQQRGVGQGGDYYWTKLSYLGRDYVALALSQYHQNRISETQLAEYLDTKPKNLAGIEEYFARSGA